ncbi:MAG: BolA family transcriptional regulator [bacterium]|nr:BolA family transcriptional regulator [bacterium]
MTNRKNRIQSIIETALSPTHLEVIDDSASHAEHLPVLSGHVNSEESHFHIIVVSDRFEGLNPVKRHREVNQLIASEFDTGLHALTIKTFTPEQWSTRA